MFMAPPLDGIPPDIAAVADYVAYARRRLDDNAWAYLDGAAGDELENADADLTFIAGQPSNNFDDLLTWVVPSILKSKMVAAGRLP